MQSEIGVLQELSRIGAGVRRERNADARAKRQRTAIELEWCMHGLQHPRREKGRFVGRVRRKLNNGEFVATEPRDCVASGDAAAQSPGRQFQQAVSGRMPERVVDVLEAVEADQEHGDASVRG